MTNAELTTALARQQAENQALRAQVAALGAAPAADVPFAAEGLLRYLLEDEYTGVVPADADQRVQWGRQRLYAAVRAGTGPGARATG